MDGSETSAPTTRPTSTPIKRPEFHSVTIERTDTDNEEIEDEDYSPGFLETPVEDNNTVIESEAEEEPQAEEEDAVLSHDDEAQNNEYDENDKY
jgi:hypothetical protein